MNRVRLCWDHTGMNEWMNEWLIKGEGKALSYSIQQINGGMMKLDYHHLQAITIIIDWG